MSRSQAILDSFPLWDTYEMIYVLLSALFLGIVLGFLVPSLWRSFRRLFRNMKKFYPHDDFSYLIHSDKIKIWNEGLEYNKVSEKIVKARLLFLDGLLKESVSEYLSILKDARVSQKQTLQCLFELAQIYHELSLDFRCVELCMEFLNRKPSEKMILDYLFLHLDRGVLEPHLNSFSRLIIGRVDPLWNIKLCHIYGDSIEKKILVGMNIEAKKALERAFSWLEPTSRLKIIKWKLSLYDFMQMSYDRNVFIELFKYRIQILNISYWFGVSDFVPFLKRCLEEDDLDSLMFFFNEDEKINEYAYLFLASVFSSMPESFLLWEGFWKKLIDKNLCKNNELWNIGEFLEDSSPLYLHRCLNCGRIELRMEWGCRSCGALESFLPVYPLLHFLGR